MKRRPSRNRLGDPNDPLKNSKSSKSISLFPRLVMLSLSAGVATLAAVYLYVEVKPILQYVTSTPSATPTPTPSATIIAIDDLERKNKAIFKSELYDISGAVDNKSLNINKIFAPEELKQVKFVCDPKSEKPTMVARTSNGDIPIIVWEYEGTPVKVTFSEIGTNESGIGL